ncbi:MAG: DUF2284 domain-containing protein [Eubacteriales bacterium]
MNDAYLKKTIGEILTPVLQSGAHPVHESTWINPQDIPFSAEIRAMCAANRCGMYGKSWSCPPGAGEWETLRDACHASDAAFLYTTCHQLEDSFDIEGMTEGKESHRRLDDRTADVLSQNGIVHTLLGVGSCTLCKACTYPDAPCRFPDRARRPMEACGIDVVSLSRAAGIRYNNGPDTVTYFSLLLLGGGFPAMCGHTTACGTSV